MFIIADLHLGKTNDSIIDEGGAASQTKDIITRLNEVLSQAISAREAITVAGDVFNKLNPTSSIIAVFLKWLSTCVENDVKVYILAGNHDSGVAWVNTHMLDNAKLPGVYVITGISEIEVEEHGGIYRRVLVVPHLPLAVRNVYTSMDDSGEPGAIDSAMWRRVGEQFPECEFCITHGQVSQSDYTNDIFFEAGNAMLLYPEALPKLKLMVAGHIHDHGVYGKVVYPGSITINNFGEVDESKGFIRVDLASLNWEWFPFSEDDVTSWRHVEIDLTDKDETSLKDADIEEIATGAVIKITVYAKRYGVVNEAYIRQLFNKYGQVTRFETVVVEDGAEISETSSYHRLSHADLLNNFVDGEDVKKDIKKRAVELGRSILEEVGE